MIQYNDKYGHNIYMDFKTYINTSKYVIGNDTWYDIMIDIVNAHVYTLMK